MRLFYDCTQSGKAWSIGVHSLSLLHRLTKVGLSDKVRAQALVPRLHYSFLREQIPRHVGPLTLTQAHWQIQELRFGFNRGYGGH